MKTLYLKNGDQKEITAEVAKGIIHALEKYGSDEDNLLLANNFEVDFVLAIRVSEIKAII